MNGAIAKANQIAANTPGAMILQQFNNADNPKAHRLEFYDICLRICFLLGFAYFFICLLY